jgi:hypothetical protein
MTILFCGGEQADFGATNGALPISTTAGNFRPTHARCAVSALVGGTNTRPIVTFPGRAQVWLGSHVRHELPGGSGNSSWTSDIVAFRDNGVNKIIIRAHVSGGLKTIRAIRVSGGTEAVLATGTVAYGTALSQLAIYIDYGTDGQISVFRNSIAVLNYVGDPRPTGSTNLDSVVLGNPDTTATAASYWSEVIVADEEDVRALSLQTLTPTTFGDLQQWTGSPADVDEVLPSSEDYLSSSMTGDRVSLKTSGIQTPTPGQQIKAVKLLSSASRSAYGPTTLRMGVRQFGTSSYQATVPLPTTFQPTDFLMQTNPLTGSAWTSDDIAALEIVFETAD